MKGSDRSKVSKWKKKGELKDVGQTHLRVFKIQGDKVVVVPPFKTLVAWYRMMERGGVPRFHGNMCEPVYRISPYGYF